MTAGTGPYLTQLHQLLFQYFNLEEIRTLCSDLNVDYGSVPGTEKQSIIRELLLALGRSGRLPELVALAGRERPFVTWPPLPDNFQLPASLASAGPAGSVIEYHYYGDVVQGEKVGGDHISVGDISGSSAVAIGRGATAIYQGLSTEEVAALVVELRRIDRPTVWDGRNPYLGLKAFQEGDAQFFFGRESLVDDLLGRVGESNFIAIAGPSGSGKSSVARAGLFHALRAGRLESSASWLLAAMQPRGEPLEQLALALERMARSPGAGDYLRQRGMEDPLALGRGLEILLSDDPRQRAVLLVDQFEELFTLTRDEVAQAAFVDLLTSAAEAGESRAVIVLALRSDFVSNCARYPELRALMSRQFQLVGAMDPQDLARAITLPTLEVGAGIDPALVSRIMADMKGEPGALPLMSFALRDLFEVEKTKKGRPMDLSLSEYLNRGGVESALERHANHVFQTFTDEQKVQARSIFSRLIEVGQGRVDTRRIATYQELIPAGAAADEVGAVVGVLAQEGVRLITISGVEESEAVGDTGEPGAATITIAHEKLIDAWPWLRQLVDENRETIALQNQVHADARAWEREGDAGFLYRGGRLIQVEEKLDALRPGLDSLSQAFVQASLDQRQREIDEEEARRRRTIYSFAIASVVFLILAAVAFLFFLRSNENEQSAQDNLARATAALIAAETSQAEAKFQRNEAQTQQAVATRALATSVVAEANAVAESTRAYEQQLVATRALATSVVAEANAVAESTRAYEQQRRAEQNLARANELYTSYLHRMVNEQGGNRTAYLPFGFHVLPGPGSTSGISEYMRRLNEADVPFFVTSVDAFGVVSEAQAIIGERRANGRPDLHTVVYRHSGVYSGQDHELEVPDYSLTPEEAAASHWKRHKDSFPPELDPTITWVETVNEPDGSLERANWLGEFSYHVALLAIADGYRYAAFAFSAGTPDVGSWRTPGMRKFLQLASENPDRIAVALHEYSYNLEENVDFQAAGFPLIGRFQEMFQVSDEMGIARPTLMITEFGWSVFEIPESAAFQKTIAGEVGAMYALYPEIKGVAIWGLGAPPMFGFGDISGRVEQLIGLVTELALETTFTVPSQSFPVIPFN